MSATIWDVTYMVPEVPKRRVRFRGFEGLGARV